MKLDFKTVPEYTKEFILKNISQEDVFVKYTGVSVQVTKNFTSPFREDRTPSCRYSYTNSGKLYYTDFGTGESYDCFSMVQMVNQCSYHKALGHILNDLHKVYKPFKEEFKRPEVERKQYRIAYQPFTRTDIHYWGSYGITIEDLIRYNVSSINQVFIIRNGEECIKLFYTRNVPIYGYKFTVNGKTGHKIYRPNADKRFKWLFIDGSRSMIEGWDQLPANGDTVILTKSLKDCMVLYKIGYPAISLQGEHNTLKPETLAKLNDRFNRVVVLYDNDEPGIKAASKITDTYGLRSITMPFDEYKDASDYAKAKGLNAVKNLLKQIL